VTEVPAVVFDDGSVVWVPPVSIDVACQSSENGATNCNFRSATLLGGTSTGSYYCHQVAV